MIAYGQNINVLIVVSYDFVGEWTAFSCCYSIRKFMPKANIYIKRLNNLGNRQFFQWLSKLKVKKTNNLDNYIGLDPMSVMVRPLEQDVFLRFLEFNNSKEIISEAKEDKFTPFVSYKEGCGKFVVADWINKDEYPFPYADRFVSDDSCVNEIQILKLWKQMNALYPILARS